MSDAIPKLNEIAERISYHLHRLEMANPERETAKPGVWWSASAWGAGSRVGIRYVSYQYTSYLTKAEAWKYLQWLDAGNAGTHRKALACP